MARFYCPLPLHTGDALSLPPSAARHVQVLRLQPGGVITLFNGQGGEFEATVTRMGRSDVEVLIGAHSATEREAACAVHLLAGITANERMDWLVEKATELGAASLTPVIAERSVLKLKGERAEKKLAAWPWPPASNVGATASHVLNLPTPWPLGWRSTPPRACCVWSCPCRPARSPCTPPCKVTLT